MQRDDVAGRLVRLFGAGLNFCPVSLAQLDFRFALSSN